MSADESDTLISEEYVEPTQYDLLTVGIVTSSGVFYEMKGVVNELNIYESIYNTVVSGDIHIKDTDNIPTKLALCGNEYLLVSFRSPDRLEYTRFFRIYKISNLRLTNLLTYEYVIHFCSEEFLLNQKIRISKSYNGFTNSEIIRDILINYLKVNEDKLQTIDTSYFEETVKTQNFIIPNMKPFEAINLLSTFSINSDFSSAFLFFETKNEFHFNSLANLYKIDPVKLVRLSPQNIISDENRIANARDYINRYEVRQQFNTLETLATGGFSSSMIKLNLIDQSFETLKFDPVSNYFELLNNSLPFNDAPMRTNGGETLNMGSAYQRYFISFQEDLTDKWVLQRAAQFSLLNSCRVTVNVAGDSELKVGDVIIVDIPDFTQVNSVDDILFDFLKSGKYLITALRHRIVDNKYMNEIEICKDSNIFALPNAEYSELYELAAKA